VPTWLLPAVLAACGLAFPLLASLASRTEEAPEGVVLLRHGPRARRLANRLLGLPPFAAALVAWRLPPGDEPVRFWPLVTVAAAAFLLLWIARIEVTGVRHRVTAEALEGGSPWRKGPRIPWGEVASVAWSAANQGFEVRGKDGKVVRISRWLTGLPALAEALERNGIAVPEELRARVSPPPGRETA